MSLQVKKRERKGAGSCRGSGTERAFTVRGGKAGKPPSGSRPGVLLDRDGVINRHLPGAYVRSWEEFEFLPGAARAIARLKGAGYAVGVITNQQGVGKGLMTMRDLDEIHRRMSEHLAAQGSAVDGIWSCTHLAAAGCACRKPEPGLLRRAAGALGIDLSRSFMVGDSASDMEAGRRAGCRIVFLGAPADAPGKDCLVFKDLRSFADALARGKVGG